LGNLNLRGEIVTLVDIKSTLNLNSTPCQNSKVVIAQVGNTVTGVAIDEICDILYLGEGDVLVRPNDSNPWIQGVTAYNNRMVSILNLPQLLQSDVLSVNQVA
jgi:purine-binding chemotaxis protein CheW